MEKFRLVRCGRIVGTCMKACMEYQEVKVKIAFFKVWTLLALP